MRGFREKLRARLYLQIENERWKVLSRQKKLIEEYARIIEQLRISDTQISRLAGPEPGFDICPQCHYRSGSSVELEPAAEEDRAGDNIMRCPDCGLVVPPGR